MSAEHQPLMLSEGARRDLTRIFTAASAKTRAKIADAMTDIEKALGADPLGCSSPLYDLPAQGMQARIAYALPLAIYLALDAEARKAYIHHIEIVAEGTP